MAEPSYEELKARVAELEKTQVRKRGSLEFKVSEKGGIASMAWDDFRSPSITSNGPGCSTRLIRFASFWKPTRLA